MASEQNQEFHENKLSEDNNEVIGGMCEEPKNNNKNTEVEKTANNQNQGISQSNQQLNEETLKDQEKLIDKDLEIVETIPQNDEKIIQIEKMVEDNINVNEEEAKLIEQGGSIKNTVYKDKLMEDGSTKKVKVDLSKS